MKRVFARTIALGMLAGGMTTACSHATMNRAQAGKQSIHLPTPEQRVLGINQSYSDADIEFMTGMIPHHAQAVIMGRWAPTHGARADVAILCERIVVGQT